jgi:methionyl-tRNA synthetase
MKKPNCTYADFLKLDLRVGEIITAAKLDGSEKLLVLSVDFGEDYGTVEILSGIAKIYTPEKLIGNKYLFIANLEPRKLMGRYSNGMIFATDTSPKFQLIKVPKKLKNGTALC